MKHLVIIGLVIPEPNSTAAGFRMLQLMELFRGFGYKISFLTAASNVEFSEKIDIINIEINDARFDELIKELNPDIVLFDRYITEEQFGWRVVEQCPKAIRIIDTEDLHFLREARKRAFFEKKEVGKVELINDIFKREISAILRSDLSLIISRYEYDLLINEFRIDASLLFYIPFLAEEINEHSPTFEERKHFVSIGNFLHEPNWQTVLRLKQLWKFIKKRVPDAELYIYGAYATEKVFQLHHEKEGFLVKGRATSVQELFSKARVLLAPIPFGAGLKGKLFESMLYGLPNVTSTMGAEAMNDGEIWNGFIEDSDTAFVEKAIALYQNQNLWEEAQQNGFKLLKNVFNKSMFEDQFGKVLSYLETHLSEHRNQNYLGQILQHQFNNSTKYMSRWIEEKNKSNKN